MKTLKPKQTADQETLRQLTKPLRLTDREWFASENPLEAHRLKIQFDEISDEYAQSVNMVRREWGEKLVATQQDWPVTVAQAIAGLPGTNVTGAIMLLRLFNNLRWAIEKDNKYLLNEAADGFPIMNYVLNEGPYIPPSDVVFGAEDRHIILEGDHKNLIYFQTQIDGLEKGRYVEYLG